MENKSNQAINAASIVTFGQLTGDFTEFAAGGWYSFNAVVSARSEVTP